MNRAGVAVIAAVLLLTGCAGQPHSSPANAKFTINGTFTYGLGYATKTQFPEGAPCDFETPITGKQVAVNNQSGTVVATATIGDGKTTWVGDQGECVYQMVIPGVPVAEKYYKLHVDGYKDTDYLKLRQVAKYDWKAEAAA